MSRKHFIALAAALKAARADLETGNAKPADVLRDVAERVADVCRTQNEHFDRARFMSAAGF